MWAQLTILLLSTISLAQGFYCSEHTYNNGYCLCTDGAWCAPQLYPTVCCDSTKIPSWFAGQWIVIDTTDPNDCVNTTVPINISTMSIGVPWNVPSSQFPTLADWAGKDIVVDEQNPLHASAQGHMAFKNHPEELYFGLTLSLDPNPPANITFTYRWLFSSVQCQGNVTLAPYRKMEEGTRRDFLSVYE